MVDKEKIKCAECGNNNVVKKGKRKSKYETVQKYLCYDCRKYFTLKRLDKKVYPTNIIMQAVGCYNLGYTIRDTAKLVNKKYKVKITKSTVNSWVNEFKNICTYYRIRDNAIKLFSPDKVIFKKVFYHQQPYKFQYHKAKVELFINEYFSKLKDYLLNVANIDNKLFKNANRGSSAKLNVDFSKVKIIRSKNYACKLASLALKISSNNRKKHNLLQEFMLLNDSCTVACETPVYIMPDDIRYYKFINTRNAQQEKLNESRIISGHIDFIQMKFGKIHVLDFKPDSNKENLADVISQLFVYALALSVRTGIWLRNFRCAWFDQDGYYEFDPNEVMLMADTTMPSWKKKEFVFDNKNGWFYTSKYFQKIRNIGKKIQVTTTGQESDEDWT